MKEAFDYVLYTGKHTKYDTASLNEFHVSKKVALSLFYLFTFKSYILLFHLNGQTFIH